MTIAKGSKALFGFGLISSLQLMAMLAFRAFWYADIYIAPEDPYGLADIIELCLFLIFFVLLFVSVLVSLVMLFRGQLQSRKAAIALMLWCVFLYLVMDPLRHLAVVWANG
ncbi:hypothetical protein [Oceanospirillum maris]|uniref:hypothetical protein n=1 Tax=Oceanospirillum maris TaxID=64977 RepID=UPI0004044C1B|nr:hypothetical protein [Oceanospirillum maris]